MGRISIENQRVYLDKFTEVFRTAGIKSVTTVIMEVPCCSGLPVVVKKAMEAAGKDIPITELVIGINGEIISQTGVPREETARHEHKVLLTA